MVDLNPAIWLPSYRGIKLNRLRCGKPVLKTIDNDLYRGLLIFNTTNYFDTLKEILEKLSFALCS